MMYAPGESYETVAILPDSCHCDPCRCDGPCRYAHWRSSGVVVREDHEGLHVQVPSDANVTVA